MTSFAAAAFLTVEQTLGVAVLLPMRRSRRAAVSGWGWCRYQ